MTSIAVAGIWATVATVTMLLTLRELRRQLDRRAVDNARLLAVETLQAKLAQAVSTQTEQVGKAVTDIGMRLVRLENEGGVKVRGVAR